MEYETFPSRVIGRDSRNLYHTMTLDIGTRAGVKAGLPVINQDGVVGQVSDAGPLTSTLLPMIQPDKTATLA